MNNDFNFDFNNLVEEDLNGIAFSFVANFHIIDCSNSYCFEITKYQKKNVENIFLFERMLTKLPISVSDVSGIELNNFKINKIYKGFFIVNYYEDNTFDIFLKKILN